MRKFLTKIALHKLQKIIIRYIVMQKTKKAFAKRFKITATGKVMRRTPGRRHLMRHKSSRQLKSSRADKVIGSAMVAQIKYAISAGL